MVELDDDEVDGDADIDRTWTFDSGGCIKEMSRLEEKVMFGEVDGA